MKPALPPLPPLAPRPPSPNSRPPFPPLQAVPTQSAAALMPLPISQPPVPIIGRSPGLTAGPNSAGVAPIGRSAASDRPANSAVGDGVAADPNSPGRPSSSHHGGV